MSRASIVRRSLPLIALAIVVCICGVIGFAALTNDAPEPYVRIYDTRVSPLYLTRVTCVGGFEIHTFAREGGEEVPPVRTDIPC